MCINRFVPIHLRPDLRPAEISSHVNRVQDKIKSSLDELANCGRELGWGVAVLQQEDFLIDA